MTGSRIEVEWGGAMRRFALPNAQIIALQDYLDLGPVELLRRLNEAAALFAGIRETIRQGLEGGGLEFDKAEALVCRHVDPALECIMLARGILTAWSTRVAVAATETNVAAGDGETTEDATKDAKGRIDMDSFWAFSSATGMQRSEFEKAEFADILYALDGWKKVHGAPESGVAPTDEEHEALKARFKDA